MDFIVWCNVRKTPETRDDEERILYDYLTENYKGDVHIIGWTSVFEIRKSYQGNVEVLKKIASDFDQRVKNLYEIEKKEEVDLEDVA